MTYKRKTKKTSSTTSRTTTQSTKGTRITNSTKSSLGGRNKRTYSWSWNKDGRMRQTTTDNRDGWITRKSRTFGSKRGDVKYKGNNKNNLLLLKLILWLFLLPFKLLWWLIKLPFQK